MIAVFTNKKAAAKLAQLIGGTVVVLKVALVLALFISSAFAQGAKVTSNPPKYTGVYKSYFGTPTKANWSSIRFPAGTWLITVDNSASGGDTLSYGFVSSGITTYTDTTSTKRFRLRAGLVDNEWWTFTDSTSIFYRAFTDTTKVIQIIVR
jgi:hypothetical protein